MFAFHSAAPATGRHPTPIGGQHVRSAAKARAQGSGSREPEFVNRRSGKVLDSHFICRLRTSLFGGKRKEQQ